MQNIDQAKELFNQLASGLTRRTDFSTYPDSVFFFKGDDVFFECNIVSGYLSCEFDKVWSVFWSWQGVSYSEVQMFIKNLAEEHFKLMDVKPQLRIGRRTPMVEEHFKLMDVKPGFMNNSPVFGVEEHFKLMGVTPGPMSPVKIAKVEKCFKLSSVEK